MNAVVGSFRMTEWKRAGLAAQRVSPPAVPAANAPAALPVALTPRERKILELVAQGLSNRNMAESLSISRLTVECHTKNIYRKLAVGKKWMGAAMGNYAGASAVGFAFGYQVSDNFNLGLGVSTATSSGSSNRVAARVQAGYAW